VYTTVLENYAGPVPIYCAAVRLTFRETGTPVTPVLGNVLTSFGFPAGRRTEGQARPAIRHILWVWTNAQQQSYSRPTAL